MSSVENLNEFLKKGCSSCGEEIVFDIDYNLQKLKEYNVPLCKACYSSRAGIKRKSLTNSPCADKTVRAGQATIDKINTLIEPKPLISFEDEKWDQAHARVHAQERKRLLGSHMPVDERAGELRTQERLTPSQGERHEMGSEESDPKQPMSNTRPVQRRVASTITNPAANAPLRPEEGRQIFSYQNQSGAQVPESLADNYGRIFTTKDEPKPLISYNNNPLPDNKLKPLGRAVTNYDKE